MDQAGTSKEFCSEHKQEEFNMYCETDAKFICTKCLDNKHAGHAVHNLKKAVASKNEELSKVMGKLDTKTCLVKCKEVIDIMNKLKGNLESAAQISDDLKKSDGTLSKFILLEERWKDTSELVHADIWWGDINDALKILQINLSSGVPETKVAGDLPAKIILNSKIELSERSLKLQKVNGINPVNVYKGHGDRFVCELRSFGKLTSIKTCGIKEGNEQVEFHTLEFPGPTDEVYVVPCLKDRYLVSTREPLSVTLYSGDLKGSQPVDTSAVAGEWNWDGFRGHQDSLLLLDANHTPSLYRGEKDRMRLACKDIPVPERSRLKCVWQTSIVCLTVIGELYCISFSDLSFSTVVDKKVVRKGDFTGVDYFSVYTSCLLEMNGGREAAVVVQTGHTQLHLFSLPTPSVLSVISLPVQNISWYAALPNMQVTVKERRDGKCSVFTIPTGGD